MGFKLAASHIEEDIDFALEAGADYVILDGRGGGTGAAPIILRNHICIPTIPALARARKHLDKQGADHVSLIIRIIFFVKISDDEYIIFNEMSRKTYYHTNLTFNFLLFMLIST